MSVRLRNPPSDYRRSDRLHSEIVCSTTIIANENANWGSSRRKVRQAVEFLRRQGFPFSLAVAEYPGHAGELATAAAVGGIDTILVIGGDGTVNEVVNGLLKTGRDRLPRIGIIPAGSSNDFSKSLGIPQHLREACRTILNGRIRDVDIGQAGPYGFCSASCLGYFAEVAARSLQMRGYGRSLRYVLPALGVIREMTTGWEMTVRTDGRTFQGAYAVLLVATRRASGDSRCFPFPA